MKQKTFWLPQCLEIPATNKISSEIQMTQIFLGDWVLVEK